MKNFENLEVLKGMNEEVITVEEMEAIEESSLVTEVENNGASGQHVNKTWYSVKIEDGEEIQVYC